MEGVNNCERDFRILRDGFLFGFKNMNKVENGEGVGRLF